MAAVTLNSSLGFSSLGASSLGASSFGLLSSGFASPLPSPSADLYLASSFSTPAAKSSSFFSKPSPKLKREKRRMTMFSPSWAINSLSTCSTVFSSSSSHFCPKSDISSYFFFKRPATIFSLMLSGFPSRSSLPISTAFSFSMTSCGTSSVVTQTIEGLAATCMATSETNFWKSSLRATKSVSQLTSARTPIFWLKCT